MKKREEEEGEGREINHHGKPRKVEPIVSTVKVGKVEPTVSTVQVGKD